jgi:FixJ family two-component response regulator
MGEALSPTGFILDDDEHVLKGLTRLLKAGGLHAMAFISAVTFLERQDLDVPGCIIVDLKMPGIDGLALQGELTRLRCMLPLIFLTAHGDVASGVAAVKAGALDYLAKPVDAQVLFAAVASAFAQNTARRTAFARRQEALRGLAQLTPREHEVMLLVAEGMLNKQVGAQLGITEKTVKLHRAKVMKKMGAHSLAMLVRMVDLAAA